MLDNNMPINEENNKKNIYAKTICSFLLTLALCCLLISVTIVNRVNLEELIMDQLIVEKSSKVNEIIFRLLYKAHTLSALVLQSHDQLENFDSIAAIIIDDPTILNVLIAPDGLVSNVYPLRGNEAVIGLNFFSEGEGNKEAVMAKDTGQMVFGGPFNLVQGGQALVGRLPVFINDANGHKEFWGLVSVTLKYPQVLEVAGLNELQRQGFAYEIWRISPDTNQKQIISRSNHSYNERTKFIEKRISILNAEWYFRILPVRAWYEYPETWVLTFLSVCISFLVAFVMQNNSELKVLKSKFEDLSYIDSLTGAFNRRYFMDFAPMYMESALRLNGTSFIIIFDLDHFKQINDRYGHLAGDKVLKNIVLRTKNMLRPGDLFARYGGEEFILFVNEFDKESAQNFTEQLRLAFSAGPISFEEKHISVTASFGIAPATPVNNLPIAIKLADEALYMAKNEGRNKVVFSE